MLQKLHNLLLGIITEVLFIFSVTRTGLWRIFIYVFTREISLHCSYFHSMVQGYLHLEFMLVNHNQLKEYKPALISWSTETIILVTNIA